MTEQKKSATPEFLFLPLESIVVEEQIRSRIDAEIESFKSLMKSIEEKGVLEPVIVTPKGDKYLLICGERRYLAAQKLGLPTISARILDTITQKDEMLALQLTENLQREDLNPMDQAKGILAFIQAKHPDLSACGDAQAGKGYDVEGIMSDLIKYNRKPDTLSEAMVSTLDTIMKISGKAYTSLFRTISLLKLPPEIQAVIWAGTLPVSQGYLFAANLDCPDLMNIFTDIMKTPVTYLTLEKLLTAYKKVKPKPGKAKPVPMTKQVASLRSLESNIEMSIATYTRPDLVTLLDELRVFCALVELRIPIAPEPLPEKKRPPQV